MLTGHRRGDEGDNTPVYRLDRIVGGHGHRQVGSQTPLPMAVDCGVLPAMGVRVKPWLWKAPMSGSGGVQWLAALVGGDAETAMPAPMAGLPGSKAMVWVGPP